MLEEIYETSGVKDLHMREETTDARGRRVIFECISLRHVSWFLIQILVLNGPMDNICIDLVTGDMTLESTPNKKQTDKTNTILSHLLSEIKRNILSKQRQYELNAIMNE